MKILFVIIPFWSLCSFALNVQELQCQKIGDYCFDPQVGLYNPTNTSKAVKLKDSADNPVRSKRVKGIGADGFFNQNVINCDENKFYDIFCKDEIKK